MSLFALPEVRYGIGGRGGIGYGIQDTRVKGKVVNQKLGAAERGPLGRAVVNSRLGRTDEAERGNGVAILQVLLVIMLLG